MIINNALRTQDILDRLNIQNRPHKTKGIAKQTASLHVPEPPFILLRLVSCVDQCESKGQWIIKKHLRPRRPGLGFLYIISELVKVTKLKSPQTYPRIPPVESSSLHRVG